MKSRRALRVTRALPAVLVVLLALGGCGTGKKDVGRTPGEQLCSLLEVLKPPNGGELPPLETELEAGAKDPSRVNSNLSAIALVFRTSEDSYDNLGAYRPAIEFTASFVELAQRGLLGPSTLSRKVLDSVLAIDRQVAAGVCHS